MCSPQVGRVFNGIATAGISEAIRPALGGGNRDLLDNMGALSLGGPFSKPAQDFLNPKPQNISQPPPQAYNYPAYSQQASPQASQLGEMFAQKPQQSPRQQAPASYDSTETQYRTVR